MLRVAPGPQRGRRHRAFHHPNPPYSARFYGDKLHIYQNEKLAMYGVTHVMAVDAFSKKIVGMVTMPVKNSITIYNVLMHPILLTDGLRQQIHVDDGSEFSLVITVQQHLSNFGQWQDQLQILQSTSRQNHRVEHVS